MMADGVPTLSLLLVVSVALARVELFPEQAPVAEFLSTHFQITNDIPICFCRESFIMAPSNTIL